MKLIIDYFRDLAVSTVRGWQRFWFTPTDPATLGLIRIFAGAMLFYTHLVWALDLEAFFGSKPWLDHAAVTGFYDNQQHYAWSYLWWLSDKPTLLWTAHLAALGVFAMLTLGLFTRVVSILAWLITVAYANRVQGALFGLDQLNALLAMYLMIGPAGAAYSVDRLIARWRQGRPLGLPRPSTGANVALRLIQVHMCVIYLFAGLSKLQGPAWWDGTAMWGAVANLEYQSMDLTWLAAHPILVNLMTHVTVAWEISYSALVWPRRTRPLVLAVAAPLHVGIALGLGMITFGTIMLVGNLAFVPSWLVRRVVDRWLPGADIDARETTAPDTATVAIQSAANTQHGRKKHRKASRASNVA